jgi:hypothetical protein
MWDCRLLGDLADLGQRHDLEPAGVREDRALPTDELVQAAELRYLLRPGSEHQVVGVAKDDVGPRPLHLIKVQALDRADGADRHEGRGADVAMESVDGAQPGGAVRAVKREAEFSGHGAGNSRLESP